MMIFVLTIWISGLLAYPFPDENKIENLEANMIKSLEEKRIADDNDEDEGEEPDDEDKETIISLEKKRTADDDYEEKGEDDAEETTMDDSKLETLGANMTLDRDSDCHPTTNDWKCCSSSHKCNEGEGDCDKDSHCEGSLKCGANNCRELYGDDKSIREKFDCCYNPGK